MDNTTRPPDRVQDSDRAYYNQALTRVVIPEPSQFPEHTGYSHTPLHEWTGPRAARFAGKEIDNG